MKAVGREAGARRQGSGSNGPALRPVDAASLIIIDRSERRPRVLVGQRSTRHVFMPGLYVFPGGRRDRNDGRSTVIGDLRPDVAQKLALRSGRSSDDARKRQIRSRSLAVAAVRETFEETGLAIGHTQETESPAAETRIVPDLAPLRYVARATTPPGQTRRFDTRFFCCFRHDLPDPDQAPSDSSELADLKWIGLDEIETIAMPAITRLVLAHLDNELNDHPALPFGRPVPYFRVERGRFVCDLI